MWASWSAATLAAAVFAVSASAQTAPRDLRSRMAQLGHAIEREDDASRLLRFFPRESALVVERTPNPAGAAGPVLRRVLSPDSVRSHIEDTIGGCAFGGALGELQGRWVYVGQGRFVPRTRGGTVRLVEWARERGSWVVRRIVEDYAIPRRLLGTAIDEVSRDTAAYAWLPEERRYAAATDWYRNNEPIVVAGHRIVKYGLPRRIGRDELEPIGSLGVVPVFIERGSGEPIEVVYVLVGPGEYQPYQDESDTVEDICGKWW